MVMLLRGHPHPYARLSKALQTDATVAVGQQFPDLRPVLRRERGHFFEIFDIHAKRLGEPGIEATLRLH